MKDFGDNLYLAEEKNNSILCSAIGSPHLNVYWTDGDIIIRDNKLRYSAELHHNHHFTQKNYTCVAENEFGSDSQTIPIEIIGKKFAIPKKTIALFLLSISTFLIS